MGQLTFQLIFDRSNGQTITNYFGICKISMVYLYFNFQYFCFIWLNPGSHKLRPPPIAGVPPEARRSPRRCTTTKPVAADLRLYANALNHLHFCKLASQHPPLTTSGPSRRRHCSSRRRESRHPPIWDVALWDLDLLPLFQICWLPDLQPTDETPQLCKGWPFIFGGKCRLWPRRRR